MSGQPFLQAFHHILAVVDLLLGKIVRSSTLGFLIDSLVFEELEVFFKVRVDRAFSSALSHNRFLDLLRWMIDHLFWWFDHRLQGIALWEQRANKLGVILRKVECKVWLGVHFSAVF